MSELSESITEKIKNRLNNYYGVGQILKIIMTASAKFLKVIPKIRRKNLKKCLYLNNKIILVKTKTNKMHVTVKVVNVFVVNPLLRIIS